MFIQQFVRERQCCFPYFIFFRCRNCITFVCTNISPLHSNQFLDLLYSFLQVMPVIKAVKFAAVQLSAYFSPPLQLTNCKLGSNIIAQLVVNCNRWILIVTATKPILLVNSLEQSFDFNLDVNSKKECKLCLFVFLCFHLYQWFLFLIFKRVRTP